MLSALTLGYSQLPKTQLLLFTLEKNKEQFHLSNPTYISSFSNGHYINQPFFISDDECLLTANPNGDEKTDIYKVNFATSEYEAFTLTLTKSEYSPTLTPDKKHISCIIEEGDGMTQSLWLYPLDQSDVGLRLAMELSDIGYHCWLNKDELFLFLLNGGSHDLHKYNLKTKSNEKINEHIGRCLKLRKNKLYYVTKPTENSMYLTTYDTMHEGNAIVSKIQAEDFEFYNDQIIISSDGQTTLYSYDIEKDKWSSIADLGFLGISKISRIAIQKNKIIIVIE
jgi:hypothetical protein